jgi:hypothetical protein
MFQSRIAIVAGAVIALMAAVAFGRINSTLDRAARQQAHDVVTRAQLAFPKLDLLRGIELMNSTVSLASDEEFGHALTPGKTKDQMRQAAFVAIEARNARLETKGRKADLIVLVGATGQVLARNLNPNAMVDEDLRAKYPLVAKVLEGQPYKDVWKFDGRLYHVAAAPIRPTGQVLGALIVGYAASTSDANADRERTGADIAYVLDNGVQASSWKRHGGETEEERDLTTAMQMEQDGVKVAEVISQGTLSKVFEVTLHGERYMAAAGPLPGNLSPAGKTAAGFVVVSSLSSARTPLSGATTWVLLLGLVALGAAVGAAVFTSMAFLVPLDSIERGVAEVINGNHNFTFEAPSPSMEGLANGLNTMMARLTGRPDPTDDEDGSTGGRWGGGEGEGAEPQAGARLSPENQRLAAESQDDYLKRLFKEYCEARTATGEGTDGLAFDAFVDKLDKNAAQLTEKFKCRTVRFKVAVKNGVTTLKPVPLP